ncbi:MAG: tetratricopeptide repeat protein [Pyrinomonadaceae bacterium]
MRYLAAFLSLILCLLGLWLSLQVGASRLLSNYSLGANYLAAANESIKWSGADPEAHYARAVILLNGGRTAAAIREFETAVALRPRDYFLWLELGRAREQANDQQGARAALQEAVKLAPYYAQPRWEFGNLLLREGQFKEAFTELNQAVGSEPHLLPVLIDLAWGASHENAALVNQLVQPHDNSGRLVLANFFVKHGKIAEAVALFRAATGISDEERSELLAQLIKARKFREAYEVWRSGDAATDRNSSGLNTIINPGFEDRIDLNNHGFGWQLATQATQAKTVNIALDNRDVHTGLYSLSVEFNGDSSPALQVISQFVLIDPGARYKLSFSAHTQQLVSGGLPVIVVSDASSTDERVLEKSVTLPPNASAWRDFSFEFTAPKTSDAIQLSLQRQSCSSQPCPAFGHIRLDDFSLQKL